MSMTMRWTLVNEAYQASQNTSSSSVRSVANQWIATPSTDPDSPARRSPMSLPLSFLSSALYFSGPCSASSEQGLSSAAVSLGHLLESIENSPFGLVKLALLSEYLPFSTGYPDCATAIL